MNEEYLPRQQRAGKTIQARLRAFDPSRVDSTQDYIAYKAGGRVKAGGLRKAAEDVRKSGRHGDDVLVHINEDEFNELRRKFGDPLINPETGIPEWGFFDSLKKVVKKVAPVLGIASLIPGLQFLSPLAAMGKGVTAVTGLTGAAANALGGAALGGITGGTKGAVTGGIGGWMGTPTADGGSPLQAFGGKILPNASAATQTMLGRGLVGAGSSALMDNDPMMGGVNAILMGGLADKVAGSDLVQRGLADKPMLQQGALGAARGAEVASLSGQDALRGAAIGGVGGAAMSALQKLSPEKFGYPGGPREVAPASGDTPAQFNYDLASQLSGSGDFNALLGSLSGFKTKDEAVASLAAMMGENPDQRPIYDAMSGFTLCDASGDFGSCLAQNWDQFMGSVRKGSPKLAMAEGGMVEALLGVAGGPPPQDGYISGRDEGYVAGPGDGQDDLINAMLADGEFVIPADVVSALGSGSTQAGAEQLDQLVQQVRKSYRSTGPKELPPKAASPLEYMMGEA